MSYTLEEQKNITENDAVVINYLASSEAEYLDDVLLFEHRWDVYFSLSSIRRYEFLFYPFERESRCMVFGDRYGSLAGVLSEKCSNVNYVLPTDELVNVVKKRYASRTNLNIETSISFKIDSSTSYDYVVVNLEYDDEYSVQDSLVFNNLVIPAISSLKDSGTLFLSAKAYKYNEIIRLLTALGTFKVRFHDPYGNGLYVIEVSKNCNLKDKALFDWSKYKLNNYYRSPLLNEKWISVNDMPNWSDFSKDQDYDKIQEVKNIQVDLLKRLSQVCKEHGLKLYPIYGTLLGLMRNGGYIGGDDDIDVCLMRDDYDKLMSLASEFNGKYFLQTPETDNCFYGGYSKLRNTQTTAIHPQNWWAECCEGISIDIFPLDYASISPKTEKNRLRKIRLYQRMLFAYSYGYFANFQDMKLLKWKFYKYLGKVTSRNGILAKFISALKNGNSKSKLAIYTHYRNGDIENVKYLNISDFNKTIKLKYEGVELDVPCGWHGILCNRYGENYLSVPPFNEYKMRHGFYDTNVPYAVWKHRFAGLKNPGSIKEPVILFGDGSLFKSCLSYYKFRVNITNLVLLPGEEKQDASVMGIPLISFEEFEKQNLAKDSYRGIICSGDNVLADLILSKKGYSGLYIFWYDRNWMLFANQSAIWKCIGEMQ